MSLVPGNDDSASGGSSDDGSCEKADIVELSDSEPVIKLEQVDRPAVKPKATPNWTPAKVRARIAFLVGTVCTCARLRKRRATSCHRQFLGDVDALTTLRLSLLKLDKEDADKKEGLKFKFERADNSKCFGS